MFKQKWWIFLVLASFLFLLAPKNIWHHCEQHNEVAHQNPKQKYFQEGDCAICDFHFYPADINHFPVFRFQKASYFHLDAFAKDQCIVFINQLLLRGPPQE